MLYASKIGSFWLSFVGWSNLLLVELRNLLHCLSMIQFLSKYDDFEVKDV